ncbi:MAG: peptidoglycan bridge formation glycyltransferase FemA/FemB family protein [Candidatus Methanoperedens sp.]|nr:peptidoglycan bridge formation glycyltransferase FemA/FemB family protein [Candidatus Methanoperedens sp.]
MVSPKEKEWNEFLIKVPNANIFQTPEMKDVYEHTKGYEPISIGIANQNNELLAIFLGVVIHVKSGLFRPFATWSTARGGPIYLNNNKSDLILNLAVEHFEKCARIKGSQYSRVYMLSNPDENIITNFDNKKWSREDSFDFLLDFSLGKEEIWNNMNKSRRYGIRKGLKNKILIEEIKDESAVDIFYELYSSMTKRNNLIRIDKSFFSAIFKYMVHKKYTKFVFAKNADNYISGIVISTYNKSIYLWFAANTKDAYRLHANELLYWHSIEEGIENGYRLFDFGGAGSQKHGGKVKGIYNYKKDFGGNLVNYGRFKTVHDPIKYFITNNMFPIYKRIVRGI